MRNKILSLTLLLTLVFLPACSLFSPYGEYSSQGMSRVSTLWIEDYVRHVGDADTYLGFDAANAFTLQAGGTEYIDAGGGAMSVNLGGAAGDDLTVDTDTLVVESDDNEVCVGCTGANSKLHVGDGATADGGLITVQTDNTSNAGLTYLLGDGSTERGYVKWDTNEDLKIKGDNIFLDMSGGEEMVVNYIGSDVDFRVRGNTDGYLLFGDAGEDAVGIGYSSLAGTTGKLLINGNVGIADTSPDATLDVSGTIGVDVSTSATNFDHLLYLTDNYTDTGLDLPANTAGIYSYGGELYSIDDAGNSNLQTPHPEELGGRYGIKSCNYHTGECLLIDLERFVEDYQNGITSGTYLTRTHMSEAKLVSWYESQQAEAAAINAKRLAEAAAVLTPTLQVDAVEAYSETITVGTGEYVTETVTTYELNSETGELEEVVSYEVTEVTEETETGKTLYRLKEGCELEAETGVFMCPVGEADAEWTPYEPQPMPDWMASRFETLFLAPQDVSGIDKPSGGEYRKLVDIGTEGALWVAKSHEAEGLLNVHDQLWAMDPAGTFGLLAAVKESGKSFYDKRVRIATDMTAQQALARRDRIANYLDTLGKDTTALRAATTEDAQVIALVEALGHTEQALWDAME